MTIRYNVSVAALAGLTACGGGGGGNLGSGIDLSAGPGSYADLDSENDRFVSFINSADSAVFPDTTVEYDGVILMGTDLAVAIIDGDGTDPSGYIGQVNLTADLTTATGFSVTGTAFNFYSTGIDASGNPDGNGSDVSESGWILSSSSRTLADFDLAVSGTVDGRNVSGVIEMTFKDSVNFAGTVDAVVGVTSQVAPLSVTGVETTSYDAFLGAD